MRGKILSVFCVILLFIPTYLAVARYFMIQNEPVAIKTVNSVSMQDTKGTNFQFVSTSNVEEEAEMIALLLDMSTSATKVKNLPEALKVAKSFEITYSSYGKNLVYQYYFSLNPAEAYYVDHNKNAFHIKEEDAKKFIASKYAVCLYKEANTPVLSLTATMSVAPQTLTWKYPTSAGEFETIQLGDGKPATAVYEMPSGVNFSFTIPPDFLSVKIYQGEDLIFDDMYENIHSFAVDTSMQVRFELDAKWYENDTRKSQGEARYSFTANVLAPAAFYLNKPEIEPGDFVVITAKNVLDSKTISFVSDPPISFEPKFFQDGAYLRALIPIAITLPDTSSYTFTFTVNDVPQTMVLNMIPKKFREQNIDIEASKVAETRNEQTIKEITDALTPVAMTSESTRYWESTFLEGVKNPSIKTGFGVYRTVNGANAYRHDGVDYIVDKNETVLGVNNGKVIFTGEFALSGKIIVIDHGLGLKSWYAHLNEISVNVGDMVKKGDTIGKTGATGMTSMNLLHMGLTIYNVSVCPYSLWEEAIILNEP